MSNQFKNKVFIGGATPYAGNAVFAYASTSKKSVVYNGNVAIFETTSGGIKIYSVMDKIKAQPFY